MKKHKGNKPKLSLAKKRVRKLEDGALDKARGGWGIYNATNTCLDGPIVVEPPPPQAATDTCATGGCPPPRINYTRLNHNQALRA